jgi:transcriptional regulator EpsA
VVHLLKGKIVGRLMGTDQIAHAAKTPAQSALLDVIESAAAIRTMEDVGQWARTVVQWILPHRLCICGLGEMRAQRIALKPLLVSSPLPCRQPQHIMASGVTLLAALLLRCRVEHQPQLHAAPCEDGSAQMNLGNVAAHGIFEAHLPDRSMFSFIAFCQIPVTPDSRHAQILTLVAPYLHVLIRCQHEAKTRNASHAAAPSAHLTKRELEVLHWLRRGKSNPEIAQILGRSQETIKIQVHSIFMKLRVSNRVQAVARAPEMDLVDSAAI